jgi:hypothetical protein
MIRVTEDSRLVMLEYETGEDAVFLKHLINIIEMRNEDKEWIKGLKEEQM